jgi:hypothetical protein
MTMSKGTFAPAKRRKATMKATASHITRPHRRPRNSRMIVAPAAAAAM